jgi:hypothetical protein
MPAACFFLLSKDGLTFVRRVKHEERVYLYHVGFYKRKCHLEDSTAGIFKPSNECLWVVN